MKKAERTKIEVIEPESYTCNMCTKEDKTYYLRLFGEYHRGQIFEIHLCMDCSDGYFDLFKDKLLIPEDIL